MPFEGDISGLRPNGAVDRSASVKSFLAATQSAELHLVNKEHPRLAKVAENAGARFIESQKMNQLLAALAGEGDIRSIDPDDEFLNQLKVVKEVLERTPFIQKLLPEDMVGDTDTQAAFVVGIVLQQIELQQSMN